MRVQMISGTDSENEFVEKKKKKGADLKGQRKLNFSSGSSAIEAPTKGWLFSIYVAMSCFYSIEKLVN